MNKYDFSFFNEPIDRRGTDCFKWDALAAKEGPELLPMWVADMDFRCAGEVTGALASRAKHPVYGYTVQTDAAVDAMLSFQERRHGVRLTREQQLLLPGVVPGLRLAVSAFTRPVDGVLIQPPVYGPFFDAPRRLGRRVVENPLVADGAGRYRMDLAGMEAAFQSGVKLALLCNPHNPVARAWTREELQGAYALCRRYDVMMVVDEIHQDFVFEPGAFVSAMTLDDGENAGLAVLTSAGKTFNIAGLQQGVLLTCNPAVKSAVADAMRAVGAEAGNIFALAGTEAAYRYGEKWLDGLLAYLDRARALLRETVAARLPKAVMAPQEATFLAWLDLRAYGFTDEELTRRTHGAGVAFSSGTAFDPVRGEGFLRLNFGCPHAQTLEAVERLEKALQ